MEEERMLVKKLAKIMGNIGAVPQTGWNNFNKYNYTTEADVQSITKNKMADENLIVIPHLVESKTREVKTRKGNTEYVFQGTWDFIIMDGDSGEEVTVRVTGEGQDSGDKGPFKALTGAHKYALMKLFQISTGDDPERDNQQTTIDNTSTNQSQNNNTSPQDDFTDNVNDIVARVEQLAIVSGQSQKAVNKAMLERVSEVTGNKEEKLSRDNLVEYNKQLRLAEINFKKAQTQQQKQGNQQESLMNGNTTTSKVAWGQ